MDSREPHASQDVTKTANKMNTKGFGSMQKFVTICRTEWDLRTERRMNSDGDAIENQCDGGDSYYCGKPAAENPEHTWVLSEAGIKATRACIQDAANRFPDNFDMYIYNDFEGYGQFEMLENVVSPQNRDLITNISSVLTLTCSSWS